MDGGKDLVLLHLLISLDILLITQDILEKVKTPRGTDVGSLYNLYALDCGRGCISSAKFFIPVKGRGVTKNLFMNQEMTLHQHHSVLGCAM